MKRDRELLWLALAITTLVYLGIFVVSLVKWMTTGGAAR